MKRTTEFRCIVADKTPENSYVERKKAHEIVMSCPLVNEAITTKYQLVTLNSVTCAVQ